MNEIGLQIFAFFVELSGIQQLSELISSLDNLDQATKDILSVVGVIACIVGLLQCFFGFKLFKFWCGVIGLFVGIAIGMTIAASGAFDASPAAGLIGLLVIIILGITGSFIAYRAYLVGLFIYAFCAAFLIGFGLFAVITNSIIIGLGVGITAGLAMGIVSVIFRRFWIIVTTCISGGTSICAGLMMVMQTTELGWGFILPPILMIAGFFVQHLTVKKGKNKTFYSQPVAPGSPLYATGAPPMYTPEQQAAGIYTAAAAPAVIVPAAPPVDPNAVTQPLPTVPAQNEVNQTGYKCDNCGQNLMNNTAPCNNCGSAVHVSGSQ